MEQERSLNPFFIRSAVEIEGNELVVPQEAS